MRMRRNARAESTLHVNKMIELPHDFFVRNDSNSRGRELLWLRPLQRRPRLASRPLVSPPLARRRLLVSLPLARRRPLVSRLPARRPLLASPPLARLRSLPLARRRLLASPPRASRLLASLPRSGPRRPRKAGIAWSAFVWATKAATASWFERLKTGGSEMRHRSSYFWALPSAYLNGMSSRPSAPDDSIRASLKPAAAPSAS